MDKKRLIASILEIVIGISLVAGSVRGLLDEYWGGMGTAMLVVGILFLIRQIKYNTNIQYREKYDIAQNDERNRYISNKAWAWAGYLFVMISAVAAIYFKIIGKEELMIIASRSVCFIILLYWGSYMVLRKKY